MCSETEARHVQARSGQGQKMRVDTPASVQPWHVDSGKRLRTLSTRRYPAKTRIRGTQSLIIYLIVYVIHMIPRYIVGNVGLRT